VPKRVYDIESLLGDSSEEDWNQASRLYDDGGARAKRYRERHPDKARGNRTKRGGRPKKYCRVCKKRSRNPEHAQLHLDSA